VSGGPAGARGSASGPDHLAGYPVESRHSADVWPGVPKSATTRTPTLAVWQTTTVGWRTQTRPR